VEGLRAEPFPPFKSPVSFVSNKGNKQWVWLALDLKTREIVGCYVGARTRSGAIGLWQSLPPVYRQYAVCYTDFWEGASSPAVQRQESVAVAYERVIPQSRHRAVSKNTGKTSLIERFNCTLRQRVSRLVRDTLSFSKKLDNHIGAIWYFIHSYNSSLLI
jgi:insertion element IS1 protein InsB